jgi:predicted transcriptional regulator
MTKAKSFIRAKDIMSKDVFVVDINSSVFNAAKLMTKYKTSCLIAMKKTDPEGMITENDITRFVTKNKDPKKSNVKSIMSSPIITANVDNSFFEVIKLMKDKSIKKIPVIKKNEIIGIITEKDMSNGIIYINKVLNKTLREGYITIEEHKKEEEILLKKLEEGFIKKEPPWVKKELSLLKKIYKEQSEVIEKISKASRKYTLTEWRKSIWLGCKYKKEKMENDEIVYKCLKLKDFCVYQNCPLNKI